MDEANSATDDDGLNEVDPNDPIVQLFCPTDVKFSQKTVGLEIWEKTATDKWEDREPYTLALNAYKFADDTLLSFDNRRLYAAQVHGLPIKPELTVVVNVYSGKQLCHELTDKSAGEFLLLWTKSKLTNELYTLRVRVRTWFAAVTMRCAAQDDKFLLTGSFEKPSLQAKPDTFSNQAKAVSSKTATETPIDTATAFAELQNCECLYIRQFPANNVMHPRNDLKDIILENQADFTVLAFTLKKNTTVKLRAGGEPSDPKGWDDLEEMVCLAENLEREEMEWMEYLIYEKEDQQLPKVPSLLPQINSAVTEQCIGDPGKISEEEVEHSNCLVIFGTDLSIAPKKSKSTSTPHEVPVKELLDVLTSGLPNQRTYASVVSQEYLVRRRRLSSFVRQLCGPVLLELQSVKAVFQKLPLTFATDLGDYLANDLAAADLLAECVVAAAKVEPQGVSIMCVKIAQTPLLRTNPRILNPTANEVYVTVFQTGELSQLRGLAACSAVSRSINLVRNMVWCLSNERVMVMSVSKVHYINCELVLKGDTFLSTMSRNKLISGLRKCKEVNSLFTSEVKIGPSPELAEKHLFFLFAFSAQVHDLAVPEMHLCLKNIDITITQYLPTFICDIKATKPVV